MKGTLLVASALLLASLASAELHMIDYSVDRNAGDELSVTIASGDLLRINLQERPGTGYTWRYANPLQSTSGVFTVEMDDYLQPETTITDENGEVQTISGQ